MLDTSPFAPRRLSRPFPRGIAILSVPHLNPARTPQERRRAQRLSADGCSPPRLHNVSLNQQVLDIIGSQYIAEVCSATAAQINIFTTAVGLTRLKMRSSPKENVGELVRWQVIPATTVAGTGHPFSLLIYSFFFQNKTKSGLVSVRRRCC